MKNQYSCPSEHCRANDGMPYRLEIPVETLMDENNIASMFCPHCQAILSLDDQSGGCNTALTHTDKK